MSAPVHAGIHIPMDRMTDACENITLRNYVADGNKYTVTLDTGFSLESNQ